MIQKTIFYAILLFLSIGLNGQDIIELKNPSFEDVPRAGNIGNPVPIKSWSDCARFAFPMETPPDIHPGNFFSVDKVAQDGDTYLGLVVRENDTYEFISQRLQGTLIAGNCYSFSVVMSKSNKYVNKMDQFNAPSTDSKRLTGPTVLRIWGGNGICNTAELLAESEIVHHNDWRIYNFIFSPASSYNYIVLEAFFKTPVLRAYSGHILIDNASPIKKVPCDKEERIAFLEEEFLKENPALASTSKPKPKKDVPTRTTITEKPADSSIAAIVPQRNNNTSSQESKRTKEPTKLLTQLDRNKIRRGQKIKIENLFFKADSANITETSYDVLDEVYDFLTENKDIVVEIGGHTNGNPGIDHKYCDDLSMRRAQSVALYLTRKGISPKRLEYHGYGKRKPIATNRTPQGRLKNQRVEIKILHMDT